MRLPTYEEIVPYIEKGLVLERAHPLDADVRIFNYSPECQFSKIWDDVTRQCRGLIMNVKTGEVLARPFPKFFNYGEHVGKGLPLPASTPIVMDKMDGMLGILYTLQDKTWIATRGAFESDAAVWATKWWRENKGDEPYGNEITYLVEIIAPHLKIVIPYEFSGVVHLDSIETATGKRVNAMLPVRRVEEYPFTSIEELKKAQTDTREGVVLYWPDDELRLKVKFDEYLRLHKLMFDLTPRRIWKGLMGPENTKLLGYQGRHAISTPLKDILKEVPDEFYTWVMSIAQPILDEVDRANAGVAKLVEDVKGMDRRSAYEHLKDAEFGGMALKALDGRDYQRELWRSVEPRVEKTYLIETEE